MCTTKKITITTHSFGTAEVLDLQLVDLPLEDGRVESPDIITTNFWVEITKDYTDSNRLTFNTGGLDEEGYSYTSESFWCELDALTGVWWIMCETSTTSRDCDGPMDTHRLMKRLPGGQWEETDSSQRDLFAEMAGY